MTKLIFAEEVFAIVGAAFEVYNKMGTGFLEPVFQEVLGMEFEARNIPFEAQKEIHIAYKGKLLKQTYRADFLVYGKIIVEIKALEKLTGREEAQLINYLKATGVEVGVLINFGSSRELEWKRFVNTRHS